MRPLILETYALLSAHLSNSCIPDQPVLASTHDPSRYLPLRSEGGPPQGLPEQRIGGNRRTILLETPHITHDLVLACQDENALVTWLHGYLRELILKIAQSWRRH